MNNVEVISALWAAFDRFDFAAAGPLLHDSFVCDWPQSGERIRGRDNFIALNQNYPGQWRIKIVRLLASGDEVVTECEVSDETVTNRAISFFRLKDGLIIHIREFWPDRMEAKADRAQWVEQL